MECAYCFSRHLEELEHNQDRMTDCVHVQRVYCMNSRCHCFIIKNLESRWVQFNKFIRETSITHIDVTIRKILLLRLCYWPTHKIWVMVKNVKYLPFWLLAALTLPQTMNTNWIIIILCSGIHMPRGLRNYKRRVRFVFFPFLWSQCRLKRSQACLNKSGSTTHMCLRNFFFNVGHRSNRHVAGVGFLIAYI